MSLVDVDSQTGHALGILLVMPLADLANESFGSLHENICTSDGRILHGIEEAVKPQHVFEGGCNVRPLCLECHIAQVGAQARIHNVAINPNIPEEMSVKAARACSGARFKGSVSSRGALRLWPGRGHPDKPFVITEGIL
ncbi:hypothetical protein V1281_004547 [Nitrobacteraceae bacterium AZCC 2161]